MHSFDGQTVKLECRQSPAHRTSGTVSKTRGFGTVDDYYAEQSGLHPQHLSQFNRTFLELGLATPTSGSETEHGIE